MVRREPPSAKGGQPGRVGKSKSSVERAEGGPFLDVIGIPTIKKRKSYWEKAHEQQEGEIARRAEKAPSDEIYRYRKEKKSLQIRKRLKTAVLDEGTGENCYISLNTKGVYYSG